MADIFNFIVWNASPEIASIGSLTLRWYGVLFASGFFIGQQILIRIYRQEGKAEKDVETITVYMLLATLIGARLGHCLFYQPDYYLKHPLEILMVWEGGLASHGATIGILVAIYLYSKRQTNQSYLYVLDRLVITIALAGCLIRMGNLMNSEIYGKQTNFAGAFVYVHGAQTALEERYNDYFSKIKLHKINDDTVVAGRRYQALDLELISNSRLSNTNISNFLTTELADYLRYTQHSDVSENILGQDAPLRPVITEIGGETVAHLKLLGIPRHPTQIYEAGMLFLLFLFLFSVYNKHKAFTPEGRIFGWFVVLLFSFRFFVEYLKAPQVTFEQNMPLNMGQLLSVPLIIAGTFVLISTYRKKNELT